MLINSFEMVICAEALEHLDNFNAVYFDFIRLAVKLSDYFIALI